MEGITRPFGNDGPSMRRGPDQQYNNEDLIIKYDENELIVVGKRTYYQQL
jgi:hypothetical protein